MSATVRIREGADVSSVEDGETFATVLEWDTQILCYEPGRKPVEFVGISADDVVIESDREEQLGHDTVVYGKKEAWEETPIHQV